MLRHGSQRMGAGCRWEITGLIDEARVLLYTADSCMSTKRPD